MQRMKAKTNFIGKEGRVMKGQEFSTYPEDRVKQLEDEGRATRVGENKEAEPVEETKVINPPENKEEQPKKRGPGRPRKNPPKE